MGCPAASWLPRADRGLWHAGYLVADRSAVPSELPPTDDSTLAEFGTQMHLAKEDHPDAADPWLSWMEPHRERLWPAHLGVHEQPWSYDCRARKVTLWVPSDGPKDVWKASRGPSCFVGTTDWHGRIPSGEPWVDDLKTGWQKPEVLTAQMLVCALVAVRTNPKFATARVSITHWRRGHDSPVRLWQQVGPLTLEDFEDELCAAWKRTLSPDPAPREGTWCRYCPSLTVCPAVMGRKRDSDG